MCYLYRGKIKVVDKDYIYVLNAFPLGSIPTLCGRTEKFNDSSTIA